MNPSNFSSSLAIASEAEIVVKLFSDAAAWLHQKKIQQWLKPLPIEFVLKEISAGHVYLFRIDDQVAATVSLSRSDREYWPEIVSADTMYLHRIAINREFAGQRLGERIMEWSENEARRNGLKFMRLDCAHANPHLLRWYPSLGYKFVDSATVRGDLVARFEKELISQSEICLLALSQTWKLAADLGLDKLTDKEIAEEAKKARQQRIKKQAESHGKT